MHCLQQSQASTSGRPCLHQHVSGWLPNKLPGTRAWTRPRRLGNGPSRRIRSLNVQAGLNYPHMPNRLRRQRQELQYAVTQQLSRLRGFLSSLPPSKEIIKVWSATLVKLEPLLSALRRQRTALLNWRLDQINRYYDFCLEETKRKYQWEAYSTNELACWSQLLATMHDWGSVLIGLFVWELIAPCAVLYTLVVPVVMASGQLDGEHPVWPLFWLVLLMMLPMKHALGAPVRLV